MSKRVMLTRPAYNRPGVTSASVGRVRIDTQEPIRRGDPHPTPLKGLGGGGQTAGSAEEKKSLQELMRLADDLAPEDRQEFLDHLALKAQAPDPAAARDVEMWAGAIYEAIQDALGASAGAMGGPMIIRRAVAAPSAWKPIQAFMQASKLSEIKVVERQSIYNMLARLLVEHAKFVAKKSGAPLSARLISNCSGSITGVFESAFPGYLHAGLATIVARRLASGGH